MSEEYFVRHCSPTLAGLKTANMFTYNYENISEMLDSLRSLNKSLKRKGLKVIPLLVENGRAIIYLYRPSALKKDLSDERALKILNDLGYAVNDSEKCLTELRKHLNKSNSELFPHEIGLFLGYPPEDVLGFIEKKKPAYKMVGNWKVYSNPEDAQRKFDSYKKCTDVYCKLWEHGVPIQKLAVRT